MKNIKKNLNILLPVKLIWWKKVFVWDDNFVSKISISRAAVQISLKHSR